MNRRLFPLYMIVGCIEAEVIGAGLGAFSPAARQ